ncbi:MAG: hypothetical protein JNK27_03475 [Chitinophagaceae bacterium]|nr:hypothetical protein [Chitinophagaceae bacterium]
MKRNILMIAATLLSVSAFAHEGHGHTHGFTIKHYFIEPEHVIPVFIVVAIAILLIKRYRSTVIKK